MTHSLRVLVPAVLVLALAVPGRARAQIGGSVGAGIAAPTGDLGDAYDTGYTLRAQASFSLVLASVHAQAGWSRFPAKSGNGLDDFDVAHAGVGGRFGLGLVFVGLNAAYFKGNGEDGMGVFPEVGVGLGPLEAVADYRIDGDAKWLGLRAALKF